MSKPDLAGNKPSYKSIFPRMIGLFKPHMGEVWFMMIFVALGVALGIVPSFLIQRIIDDGLLGKQNQGQVDWTLTGNLSIVTILVILGAAGATLVYGYKSVVIGQKIMCTLRMNLFKHLQKMSLRFFTTARTGDIQTRLISDVGGIQNVVSNTLVDFISNIAIVISSLVAMFAMDWRLTVLVLALIPLFGWFGQWVGKFSRDVRKGTQEQTSEINSLMQENLSVSGALLGKTIGRSDVLEAKFESENLELARWQVKSSILQYVFFAMIRVITQVIPVLVYWLVAYLMFHGDKSLSVGKVVGFTGLQARMLFPLTGIMGLQVEIMGSMAPFQRIFEYLDMPIDIAEAPDAKPLPRSQVKGHISMKDVGFQYERGGETWNLSGVNLEAEPGQLVALVGPSGAGKTTLTYMIPRLYDVDRGVVEIDGTDVRDILLEDLKAAVGMVTQETYLVHTTIAENLRIAKPNATQQELEEACKAASIHEHIASLPEGYETVVGERGYKLSGGEKQRIAIARAILKNPPILILDEATSALDTTSERLIQASLNVLMKGRTTFAIAHRLSTILSADQILVVDDGKIVERGRHEDLLALGGLYAKLYNQQFESANETAEAHI